MHIICGDQYEALSCLREELSSNRILFHMVKCQCFMSSVIDEIDITSVRPWVNWKWKFTITVLVGYIDLYTEHSFMHCQCQTCCFKLTTLNSLRTKNDQMSLVLFVPQNYMSYVFKYLWIIVIRSFHRELIIFKILWDVPF